MSHRLSPAARGDVADIAAHIAADDPRAAQRWLAALRGTFRRIAAHPGLGTDKGTIRPGLRMFPTGAYVILYQVDGRRVDILRVVHGARLWPELL